MLCKKNNPCNAIHEYEIFTLYGKSSLEYIVDAGRGRIYLIAFVNAFAVFQSSFLLSLKPAVVGVLFTDLTISHEFREFN